MDGDKFTTKSGEMDVTKPQCSTCKENTGVKSCAVYIEKPFKYALNLEECPEYVKE